MGERIKKDPIRMELRCQMCGKAKPDVKVYAFMGQAAMCERCAELFQAIWFGD
jgi:hypothetical protein